MVFCRVSSATSTASLCALLVLLAGAAGVTERRMWRPRAPPLKSQSLTVVN
jgi:hypothetical protein